MQLRAKLAAATLAATVIGGGALMPTFAERGAGEQPPVGIQAGEADRRWHQRADDRHGHLRPERRLPPVALGLAGADDQREGVLRLELPGRLERRLGLQREAADAEHHRLPVQRPAAVPQGDRGRGLRPVRRGRQRQLLQLLEAGQRHHHLTLLDQLTSSTPGSPQRRSRASSHGSVDAHLRHPRPVIGAVDGDVDDAWRLGERGGQRPDGLLEVLARDVRPGAVVGERLDQHELVGILGARATTRTTGSPGSARVASVKSRTRSSQRSDQSGFVVNFTTIRITCVTLGSRSIAPRRRGRRRLEATAAAPGARARARCIARRMGVSMSRWCAERPCWSGRIRWPACARAWSRPPPGTADWSC